MKKKKIFVTLVCLASLWAFALWKGPEYKVVNAFSTEADRTNTCVLNIIVTNTWSSAQLKEIALETFKEYQHENPDSDADSFTVKFYHNQHDLENNENFDEITFDQQLL